MNKVLIFFVTLVTSMFLFSFETKAQTCTGTCKLTCNTAIEYEDNGSSCEEGKKCCLLKSKAFDTTYSPSATPAVSSGVSMNKFSYVDPMGGRSIPGIIGSIIAGILPLVGALFLVMFIWGGILWMSSAGDSAKVSKARNTLINAIIGIFIVVGAYMLVSRILQVL